MASSTACLAEGCAFPPSPFDMHPDLRSPLQEESREHRGLSVSCSPICCHLPIIARWSAGPSNVGTRGSLCDPEFLGELFDKQVCNATGPAIWVKSY